MSVFDPRHATLVAASHTHPPASWRWTADDATAFPPLLRETPRAPRGIYIHGIAPEQEQYTKVVAIVGTRKARESSCLLAEQWAAALVHAGYVVVSGMASGIDAAAHRGALSVATATTSPACVTIAVLATGPDQCYPRKHRTLHHALLQHGCTMTEYPPGTIPFPSFFLERNRIVAGLARAIIVIEAPMKSGALSTANHAADANRDVFAVPGAVHDPQFEGSNKLIREGATLVRNIADVFEGLGEIGALTTVAGEHKIPFRSYVPTPDETIIISTLERTGPLSIDKIVALTKLSTHIVSRTLTTLALNHAIKEIDNRYALAR